MPRSNERLLLERPSLGVIEAIFFINPWFWQTFQHFKQFHQMEFN
jgi:hypothetical protein